MSFPHQRVTPVAKHVPEFTARARPREAVTPPAVRTRTGMAWALLTGAVSGSLLTLVLCTITRLRREIRGTTR